MATVDDKKIIFSMVGLNKTIQQNNKQVLKNIYLSFFYGAKIGIIGLNGSGKSTLLKIIAGLDKSYQGEVVFSPGYSVGYLAQEPYLDPTKTVKEVVMEGVQPIVDALTEYEEINQKFGLPEYYEDQDKMDKLFSRQAELQDIIDATDAWNLDSKLERAMDALRCPPEDQPVKNLSGGERRRVALCRLLLQKPDILLLDEPTNDLDLETVMWLENYLANFEHTVLVVSHDRHFLDSVCTHTVDIDYSDINLFSGNYSFWYESSQLALRQQQNQNKKAEEKKKELLEFIQRFSANVAKSKQTTSRRKMLERLNIEEIKPSMRKYPGIIFQPEREAGTKILGVDELSKTVNGERLFSDVSFTVEKGDKIAFLARDPRAVSALFDILVGDDKADSGVVEWGTTINYAYLPLNNAPWFESQLSIVDWLAQFSSDTSELYLRGYLGKMLFSGEEIYKKVSVLSGGEKVRCMVAKMMIQQPNTLVLDSPTNHLDLESIQAFNNSLINFKGNVLMSSHDHEFVNTVANRIIELTPNGMVDRYMEYDDYITDEVVARRLEALWA